MVRALGINVGVVFGVTFFVGAFLAGMGGVMGASFAGVAPGTDGQWLLNSLIVVIIGGLGSIKGAVAGSLLYGMVTPSRPPTCRRTTPSTRSSSRSCCSRVVLAVRPNGLFGRSSSDDARPRPAHAVVRRACSRGRACAF